MIQIVNEQIKALFKTKRAFCEHTGQRYGDLGSKLRTLQSKLKWCNDFLRPIGLRVNIALAKTTTDDLHDDGSEQV